MKNILWSNYSTAKSFLTAQEHKYRYYERIDRTGY